jgi:hypothetical protein
MWILYIAGSIAIGILTFLIIGAIFFILSKFNIKELLTGVGLVICILVVTFIVGAGIRLLLGI